MSQWPNGGLVTWIEGKTAYVSSVFSWNRDKAYMKSVYLRSLGYYVRCGGPTVFMYPEVFKDFDTAGQVNALPHHNPNAVFTSRGCIRNCTFCLVPRMEGYIRELPDWEVKPIICDNNLLATSQAHFDRVIDRLLKHKVSGIDFNQGLDARLLNDHHAKRLASLPKNTIIRLAWDHISQEKQYITAFERLIQAGVYSNQIRTYVLIGYKDTPGDARYRLEKIRSLGALPNPMRYQPLDSVKKNTYIGPAWTDALLKGYMRYWSNLKITGAVPFDEYKRRENLPYYDPNQTTLFKEMEPTHE
jgi:hypothetical protein